VLRVKGLEEAEGESMKPICVPCQRFFRVKKTGLYFTEGMPITHARPASGTAEPENWKPYKIWAGDLWECLGCGAKIISGTGMNSIAEHFESDFEEKQRELGADQFQVNDC